MNWMHLLAKVGNELLFSVAAITAPVFALRWAWLATRRDPSSDQLSMISRVRRALKPALWAGSSMLVLTLGVDLIPSFLLVHRARNGYAQAQSNLGIEYWNGDGLFKRDPTMALQWFNRAAEQGDHMAQSYLVASYLQGIGVPKDPARAEYWLKRAVAPH